MADNVTDIVLDIPADVLQNIKNADKAIKQLEATSKHAAKTIKGHFDNTMVSGVNAFIKKVNEAQTRLGSVKMPTIDATGLSAAIAELSKAMSTIDKSATTGSRRLEKIADAITKLETAKPAPATFKAIADGITEIGRTSDGTIDKIRSLSDMMAKLARDIRTVESAHKKMSSDTAMASQYNKLYKEQAQIVRELNTLNSKPSKTPEEIALLNRLQDRYVEIGKAIDDLNKKKQTAASKLAREQGKLRAELTTNISDPVGAINYAKQAKSLNELQAAYKNLKAVMATTKPDTKEWAQMNAQLEKTRNRIDEIRKKMGEFKNTAKGVGDIAGQLARTLAATFSVSAITGYINKMIQVRAQFELQQTALRAILQDKDEADRIFMQVQQLALQSPFSIMQMTNYTKQLAAYRIESEKLVGTTKMLADVSAGLGVDMGRLILAYGQVKAANYLRACLGKGTKVKMFDGSYKNVEDVVVGDVLMGDDEQPRHVSKLYQGEQQMYRISHKGGSFRCNEHHILTVYDALCDCISDVFVTEVFNSSLVYRYQGVRRVDGKYEPFFMEVEKDTVDTYYGFSIDGNHRFIIEDNVVTHNTEVRQFTEAGLNIAGELANYFSELQGKMISVGDVMDMITKRMVRFEDVEEVFKRVTSAGGLFYDMQKKQSETLWGQLQRIKDAMSIMFNEIGKSNQTAISGALTIIRSLLANWRIFANLLTGASLAFAAYTVKTIAAAVATNTFNASQKGLVGALARSKAALLAFTKFLSANPYILAITGVVALGSALLDWKQKVDSAREAYDNMIVGISERESKLTAIADKVADTNKRITESQQAMKKSKVGTNEYTDAVEANKQAMLEQNRALQELRNNFPEVYRQMVQTKDGVVDLTEGIKAFTESASQQRVITTLQSDNAGWTNDDLKEDLEELAQSQAKYDAAIMSATASSEALFAKVQAIYETEKATGNVSEDISKFYKGLLDLKDQELSKEERLRKIVGLRNQMSVDGMLKLDKAYSDFYGKYQKTINTGGWTNIKSSLEKDTAEATKEIDKLLNNVLVSAGVTSVQMFEGLKDGTKQSTAIALNGFIKDLGLSLDEAQKTLLNANLFAPLKITPYWEMSALPQQMSFLQEKINGYIEEHNIGSIVADIQVSDNTDSYFKGLVQQYRSAKDEIEQLERATTQIAEDGNAARIAELKAEQKEREDMFKAFGIEWRTKTELGGRQKDVWTPRLNLMQKVNKEYEKLLKYYSQEEAMAKIRTSYGDAVAEAFKGTQWADISKWGTFDAQATVDRLKKLAEVAGKDAKKKILEAVGTLEAEIEIKVKEREIQQAKDEIQKAFDNYELTKTLGNLGLNVDLAYMVGGQPMTLPQIRKDIEDKLKVAKATDGQEELVKTYEDYLRKVSDMENKAAVERLKNYNKYLLESMSERVRIEMETAQLINKIRQDETLDAETKTMAIQRAKQEEQKKLSQQAWKDFQSTDVYISLFEDVQRASSQSIDFVLNKLHSLRDSLKNLPADQVRAIVKQIESLEQEQVQRNPFKALKDNLGGVISNMREYARLEKEHLANTEKLAGATAFRDDTQKRVALLSEQLNAEKARTDITKDEKAEHDKIIQALERELAVHKGILKAQNMQVEGLTESVTESGAKLNILKAQFKSVGTGLQSIGDYAKELGNTIGNVASSLENVFGTMSDGTADTISSIQEILGGVGDLAGGVGRIVSGDTIGGVMQAVTGLASTIGSVFAIGDKKKERQIQRLQGKVEDLQKAYEKLGTAIEEAYSYDDYNMAYEQSLSNLEQQRRAIEEQMALEKAKKKTDKDKLKEYEDALEQIAEEEKQLRNQFYQDWGSYSTDQLKSASEDFASAWYEAFKETGDGLDALNEKWDDYFENLILKQIASAVTQKRLSKYVDDINALLDQKDLSEAERAKRMKEIWDRAQNESSVLDNELQNLMEYLGIKGGQGDLLLSDLQKGIQNITEPQAAAIEAYLNSMRFAVFEQNNILTEMLTAIQAQYGTSTDNPILSEVKAIRSLVASIDERLGRVIVSRNSGANNYIMKVG